MAEFEQAVERTLEWEGGYGQSPHDPGGETLFGIASVIPNGVGGAVWMP